MEIGIAILVFCGVFALIYIGLEVMNRKRTNDVVDEDTPQTPAEEQDARPETEE